MFTTNAYGQNVTCARTLEPAPMMPSTASSCPCAHVTDHDVYGESGWGSARIIATLQVPHRAPSGSHGRGKLLGSLASHHSLTI